MTSLSLRHESPAKPVYLFGPFSGSVLNKNSGKVSHNVNLGESCSALNLNIHFHMLFLDGVYIGNSNQHPVRFRRVKAPTRDELIKLTHSIAARIARFLDRLCRYITRPAVSTKRLSLTRNGRVRYELKTSWRNGTTHVIFESLDFMYRTYGLPRQPHYCRIAGLRRRPA